MSAFRNVPDSGSPSWKIPVPTVADLPSTGNKDGDVRAVLDTNTLYMWDQPTTSWVLAADPAGTAQALFDILGNKYVRTTRFAIISSGSSGTVTLPPNSTVVLDDFGGTTDAIIARTSGGFPTLLSARTAAQVVIATTFNSSGAWVLTGTPSAYPIAILYRVRQKLSEFDSTASDIWGNSVTEDYAQSQTLSNLSAYNTNGLLTQTAASTFTGRTVTGTASNITVTNGSGVSGNPTIDLTNAGTAGTYSRPAVITTDAKGRATSVIELDPSKYTPVLFDDFICDSVAGTIGWNGVNSGAGTAPVPTVAGTEVFNLAMGAMELDTGTTATGRSAITLGQVMGVGWISLWNKWRMHLPSGLSDGTNTYQATFGYGDTPTGANINQTNGIRFIYNDAISANWVCETIAAGVATQTITSVVVVSGSWINFEIRVNGTGTSVTFFINGVLVATHTTNIPGFLQWFGPLAKINKTVGTTSRLLLVDYFWQKLDWTGTR